MKHLKTLNEFLQCFLDRRWQWVTVGRAGETPRGDTIEIEHSELCVSLYPRRQTRKGPNNEGCCLAKRISAQTVIKSSGSSVHCSLPREDEPKSSSE